MRRVCAQVEKESEAAALEVLHSKCALQDVFADSRFLKQEALQVSRGGGREGVKRMEMMVEVTGSLRACLFVLCIIMLSDFQHGVGSWTPPLFT